MLLQAQLKRDPHRKGIGIPASNGFTVIELMLVLIVLGGIAALALPSYSTVLEKRQVTSGAQQMSAFLSAAQLEAVKRNEKIAVDYEMTDSKTWCLGLKSGDTECDCKNDQAACLLTDDPQIRVFTNLNLTYPDIMDGVPGGWAFVYDQVRGLARDPITDAPIGLVSLELLSRTGKYALNVQITATGRLKTCSKDPSTKVPGYDEC